MTNAAQSTDVRIIQRILAGEQAAFGELMAKYEAPFLRFAQQFTKDEDDAADVVQEAFIKIYRNLSAFNQKRPFSSWGYRIVRNEALNWLRARKRLTFGERAEFMLNQLFAIGSPELEYASVELKEQLSDAFAQLPDAYATPLKMHFLDERSYKEIGDALNLPIGTVGTRINRAKAMLKAYWARPTTNDEARTD